MRTAWQVAPRTTRKARPRCRKGVKELQACSYGRSLSDYSSVLRGKCNPSFFPVKSTQKQSEQRKAQGRLQKPERPAQPSADPAEPSSSHRACQNALDPAWPPSYHGSEAGLHLRLDAHWGGFPHHREDRRGDFSTIYGTKGRLLNGTLLPSAKPSLPNSRWPLHMHENHSGDSQRITLGNQAP